MKKIRENKVVNLIFKTIRSIVIILLVGFIIVVCLQRFSNNKISFLDYRMFTVVTGSMKPKYIVGDVLIAKKVEPETIKVGDTITYQGVKGDFYNKVVTHEVIKIGQDEDNNYFFHTKGKANLIEDPIVYEDQIFGVVIYKSIVLSTIYRIVSTDLGFYLFIIIPLLFIIVSEIIATLLEKEERRRAKLKESS